MSAGLVAMAARVSGDPGAVAQAESDPAARHAARHRGCGGLPRRADGDAHSRRQHVRATGRSDPQARSCAPPRCRSRSRRRPGMPRRSPRLSPTEAARLSAAMRPRPRCSRPRQRPRVREPGRDQPGRRRRERTGRARPRGRRGCGRLGALRAGLQPLRAVALAAFLDRLALVRRAAGTGYRDAVLLADLAPIRRPVLLARRARPRRLEHAFSLTRRAEPTPRAASPATGDALRPPSAENPEATTRDL